VVKKRKEEKEIKPKKEDALKKVASFPPTLIPMIEKI